MRLRAGRGAEAAPAKEKGAAPRGAKCGPPTGSLCVPWRCVKSLQEQEYVDKGTSLTYRTVLGVCTVKGAEIFPSFPREDMKVLIQRTHGLHPVTTDPVTS